jgi:selenocysteine-specific elongation factor
MRSIVIGTAGHIDHGKSALVRALTGTDPDRLKEEQARGITIDLGFAHLTRNSVNLAFVDVPGHERFVKNMLAGAGGIDLVMLVVAADESVMPQTREHFAICRLLQVPAGVVVLTKSDLADQDMQDLAALEVRELTAGSFLADAPIIPVSSVTSRGLDELAATLVTLAGQVTPRPSEGPARLPVDRVFTVKGFGTVVTGTLVAGELRADQELVALPRGLPVKVRGLQVHGHDEARAGAGRRVAVNLVGVDVADLSRGDTLCTPGSLEPTRRMDVALDLLADARPLRHGTRLRVHQGTAEILGRVALAGPRLGEGSATELPAGGSAYARIRLEAPLVVTRGDRFIVRAYSPPLTIGGGVVLDPQPSRGAIRTAAGLSRFRRLDRDSGDPDAAVRAFIDERGGAGLPHAMLQSRAGLRPDEAAATVPRLVKSGDVTAIGDLLVATAVLRDLEDRLLKALEVYHRSQPLSDGLPREEARDRVFGGASGPVFDRVLLSLVGEGKLLARDRLALAGHQVSLTPEEARAQDALERIFREAALTPPDMAAASASAGVTAAVADRVVKLLLRRGVLVKLDTLIFDATSLERLKFEIQALKASGVSRVDVAAFKERYGVSRKYAIPLLEFLDRERLTRRAGDSRILL